MKRKLGVLTLLIFLLCGSVGCSLIHQTPSKPKPIDVIWGMRGEVNPKTQEVFDNYDWVVCSKEVFLRR